MRVVVTAVGQPLRFLVILVVRRVRALDSFLRCMAVIMARVVVALVIVGVVVGAARVIARSRGRFGRRSWGRRNLERRVLGLGQHDAGGLKHASTSTTEANQRSIVSQHQILFLQRFVAL
jgi:hypothetical protein